MATTPPAQSPKSAGRALRFGRRAELGHDRGDASSSSVASRLAVRVLRDAGADTIEEHRNRGYILASFGMTLLSAGTEAGVFINALGPSDCAVRVITLRKVATNAFTELREESFHERFSAFLTAPDPAVR